MRLITWNVAARVVRQPEQAEVIARTRADVVALQEVTVRTLPMWRAALAKMGFAACEATLDGASRGVGRRLLGVLTAAREPLRLDDLYSLEGAAEGPLRPGHDLAIVRRRLDR